MPGLHCDEMKAAVFGISDGIRKQKITVASPICSEKKFFKRIDAVDVDLRRRMCERIYAIGETS